LRLRRNHGSAANRDWNPETLRLRRNPGSAANRDWNPEASPKSRERSEPGLKLWNPETLRLRRNPGSAANRDWNPETLKPWNSETLKPWNSKTNNVSKQLPSKMLVSVFQNLASPSSPFGSVQCFSVVQNKGLWQ
jgi:hypothetical protein